jgi:hypothetical protein
MFGGLIAMARRQKMFEPVADPPVSIENFIRS